MKHAAVVLLLVGLTASPAFAQGRGNGNGQGRNKNKIASQGIPPGHVPPDGMCRVWYEGVAPGRQPRPTSCNEAERVASRDRAARVIYGDRTNQNVPVYRDDPWSPGDIWREGRLPDTDGRRPNPTGQNRTGRAVPRDEQYPNGYPDARYPQQGGGYGYGSEANRRGYDDGVVKGREDLGDRDSYDPARHSWYRNADRGYNSRYGSKDDYRSEYRRGFLAGYEATYGRRY